MTPLRLLLLIKAMCDGTSTVAQIKTMLTDVKTSAMSNPNSPSRLHDVAFYCDRITEAIPLMETSVPPWPPADIKQQISGRITSIVPIGV